MDIFNIEKTEQEKKIEEIRRQADQRRYGLDCFITAYERSFRDFWHSDIVSPQEICDSLGTNAYQLFQAMEATQNYIKALRPDWVELTPPQVFTVNEDGTISIE